jgi:hypothetical protein
MLKQHHFSLYNHKKVQLLSIIVKQQLIVCATSPMLILYPFCVLRGCRDAAVHHMTLNHTRRTQQQTLAESGPYASNGSCSNPAGLAGSGLLLNSSSSSNPYYNSHTTAAGGKAAAWLSSSHAAAGTAMLGAGSSQLLHRTAGKAAAVPGQLLSRRTVMDAIVEVRPPCDMMCFHVLLVCSSC